jgi:prepilin-type N-terminal cleavage/methylation domain-containing protein
MRLNHHQQDSANRQGFTLIELLVTITVLVIIIGVGIAGFIRFNQKQILTNAGKELQSFLRSAQGMAINHEVPAGCVTTGVSPGKLWAYRVTIPTAVGGVVNMNARCSADKNSLASVSPARSSYQLPTGVSLSAAGAYDIDFYVKQGGVGVYLNGAIQSPPVANIVLVSSSGGSFTFQVKQGGEISEGVYAP